MLNCYTPEAETMRLVREYSCKKVLFAEQAEQHLPAHVEAIRIPGLPSLIGGEAVDAIDMDNTYDSLEHRVVAVRYLIVKRFLSHFD